ncbi:hypothetical protein AB9128_26185 [Streptomyces cinereoruber]|uniref:hypothetical protein n=1 Tax=Streptomyces cinereoruber TaxID=67260 RepID=UPI003EBF8DCF
MRTQNREIAHGGCPYRPSWDVRPCRPAQAPARARAASGSHVARWPRIDVTADAIGGLRTLPTLSADGFDRPGTARSTASAERNPAPARHGTGPSP